MTTDAEVVSAPELEGNPAPELAAPSLEPAPEEPNHAEENTKLRAELEELRSTVNALAATRTSHKEAAPAPIPYDYATQLFVDPNAALTKLRAEIVSEVTNQYQAAENTKQFWSDFYSSNPDLKNDDFIVKAVLNRDLSELSPMQASKAMKELAKRTKAELLRSMPKASPDKGGPALEGPSTTRSKTAAPTNTSEITSLSQVIKERQAARFGATSRKKT